jgi:hypothetical protein
LNENNEVVDGQLRVEACKRAGLKEIVGIKCKFNEPFLERTVSLLSDTAHYPLSRRDKFNFMKRAIELDNKSLEEISLATGIGVSTLRGWYDWGKSPEIVDKLSSESLSKEDSKALDEYLEEGVKKKLTTDTILKRKPYSEDPMKAIKVIKASTQLPLRELELMSKETKEKIEVDVDKRMELYSGPLAFIQLRVPMPMYKKLVEYCKRSGRDVVQVLNDLIRDFLSKV